MTTEKFTYGVTSEPVPEDQVIRVTSTDYGTASTEAVQPPPAPARPFLNEWRVHSCGQRHASCRQLLECHYRAAVVTGQPGAYAVVSECGEKIHMTRTVGRARRIAAEQHPQDGYVVAVLLDVPAIVLDPSS